MQFCQDTNLGAVTRALQSPAHPYIWVPLPGSNCADGTPFVTKNRLTPPHPPPPLQKVVWDVQYFLRQYHIIMSRLKVAFVAKNALGIFETWCVCLVHNWTSFSNQKRYNFASHPSQQPLSVSRLDVKVSVYEWHSFDSKLQSLQSLVIKESLLKIQGVFYRTQVNLGSDLWVRMSPTNKQRFVRLNWCDSGWWGYQLNTNW